MPFCTKCGKELVNDAKFCANCGTAVMEPAADLAAWSANQRKQTFEGEIRKCPNCGEPLKSFMTSCPLCGHEIRGTAVSSIVKEFTNKLEAIDTEPPPRKEAFGERNKIRMS